MKFRTDFVTNSSSSSFFTLTINLTDDTEITYRSKYDVEGFFGEEYVKKLINIKNMSDLVDFLIDFWEDSSSYIGINKLSEITSFEDIVSIDIEEERKGYGSEYEVDWDENYDEDDEDYDFAGAYSSDYRNNSYNFKTKKYEGEYSYEVNTRKTIKREETLQDNSWENKWPDEDFVVKYSNSVIEKLAEEYHCIFEDEDYELCNIWNPKPFTYYGAGDLEHLTKSIISYIITFGKADDGFAEALWENEELIRTHFTKLNGYFIVGFKQQYVKERGLKGAEFELVNGKLEYAYRVGYDGW